MRKQCCLVLHGLHPLRVIVPNAGHSNARGTVKVALSLRVEQVCPFAAFEAQAAFPANSILVVVARQILHVHVLPGFSGHATQRGIAGKCRPACNMESRKGSAEHDGSTRWGVCCQRLRWQNKMNWQRCRGKWATLLAAKRRFGKESAKATGRGEFAGNLKLKGEIHPFAPPLHPFATPRGTLPVPCGAGHWRNRKVHCCCSCSAAESKGIHSIPNRAAQPLLPPPSSLPPPSLLPPPCGTPAGAYCSPTPYRRNTTRT